MFPTETPARADALLAVIAVAFVVAVAAAHATGVPLRVTALAGSLVGCVAMADGLVVNPPTDE
ncbi:MAG: hypothetical protein ABEJ28_01175 [Salinigranum sp.]